ncbi:MAG: tetratricopeptide repeat protein [Planctomycetota bacterium]|jgi:tetratricopeptide (TPR) repeat protein
MPRFHLSLFLAALCAACASQPETKIDPEVQLEIYRETALTHYLNRDLARAESQALKGLELDDEDKALRLLVGSIELKRGTPEGLERAAWVFRNYLRDHPGEQRALIGLAGALEGLGEVQLAVATAIERGERLPDRSTPEKRARQLREDSEESWEEALELYTEAFEQRDDSIDALDGLQRVTARLGRYEESLSWSAELLERATIDRDWYRGRLENSNLNESEEKRLREGERRSRRRMVNTQLFVSAQLVDQGRLPAAMAALDVALDIDPTLVDAYSRRAQLRYLLEDYSGARADVERFISSSSLPTDHPDVTRAFELLDYAQREDPNLEWVVTTTR